MKNNQLKQGDKMDEHSIKSLFCYGDERIKKMIWSLKTNRGFCNSEDGKKLIEVVRREIQYTNTLIVCVPSSSFWQNKKGFDQMHYLMKAIFNGWKPLLTNLKYIPYAIVPSLNKDSQKVLNKKERQEQSREAYALSNYFKYLLKKDITAESILVIDDVKTTGSTITECIRVIEKYSSGRYQKISGLTIAYEA